jgi:hypothetical protein
VRNYRASEDLVVAALPSVFEYVRGFLDVGAAGVAGFTDDFARRTESRHLAKGGHGAVFGDARNYPALVHYVLGTGGCEGTEECDAYELPPELRTDIQSRLAIVLYRFSVLVWLGAIMIVGTAAYTVSRAVTSARPVRTRFGQFVRSTVAGFAVIGVLIAFLRYF